MITGVASGGVTFRFRLFGRAPRARLSTRSTRSTRTTLDLLLVVLTLSRSLVSLYSVFVVFPLHSFVSFRCPSEPNEATKGDSESPGALYFVLHTSTIHKYEDSVTNSGQQDGTGAEGNRLCGCHIAVRCSACHLHTCAQWRY